METNNNELEEMRQQLALLNSKLENQTIVNDRLMRNAMSGKMSWIRKLVWGEIVGVPLVILLFLAIRQVYGLSFGPIIMISLLMIVSTIMDYKINKVGSSNIFSGNLKETTKVLTKMKKRRILQEYVAAPLSLIVFGWFFYDIINNTPATGFMHEAMTGALIGGLVGGVIGLVAAIYIVVKMQRTNDELIRQINELLD